MPEKHNEAIEPRRKDLREHAAEAINANIVEVIREAFTAIDRHTSEAKKKARQMGLKGMDGLIEGAADAIKRKSAELATGRKIPE